MYQNKQSEELNKELLNILEKTLQPYQLEIMSFSPATLELYSGLKEKVHYYSSPKIILSQFLEKEKQILLVCSSTGEMENILQQLLSKLCNLSQEQWKLLLSK